jgi:hypothetical protein
MTAGRGLMKASLAFLSRENQCLNPDDERYNDTLPLCVCFAARIPLCQLVAANSLLWHRRARYDGKCGIKARMVQSYATWSRTKQPPDQIRAVHRICSIDFTDHIATEHLLTPTSLSAWVYLPNLLAI